MNFSDARATAIIDALMNGEIPPLGGGEVPTTAEILDIIMGGFNDPPDDDPFWDSIKVTVPIGCQGSAEITLL